MKRLLIAGVVGVAAALAVGIALAVAATTGGSDASKTARATVSVKRIAGMGKVLVDSRGRALYMNDEERGAKVLCDGACLSFWQPLTVHGKPKGASLPGKLATLARSGGARQVTYNGKRLYSFKLDKAGKVTGDGFKDAFGGQSFVWHVEHPVATKRTGTAPKPTPPPTYTFPGY